MTLDVTITKKHTAGRRFHSQYDDALCAAIREQHPEIKPRVGYGIVAARGTDRVFSFDANRYNAEAHSQLAAGYIPQISLTLKEV